MLAETVGTNPQYPALLRQELSVRNLAYARQHDLPHVTSYGQPPVVVYQVADCGRRHGNFLSASFREILRRPDWRRRLSKVHSQAHGLPKADWIWRELDSSTSSDALLMNIFCYPGVTRIRELSLLLGTEGGEIPEFGFRPRVPLVSDRVERTEVDMKSGGVLFEAKLTEGDFQVQKPEIVEQYCGFKEIFDSRGLPRKARKYVSYQLLRNVLAAYALEMSICVLLDARRLDLLELWYAVMRCVRITTLRTRCKVLTWQELADCLPPTLQEFLEMKYGIVSGGS